MSDRTSRRVTRSCVVLSAAICFPFASAASAAPVDLATSSAFVVLGGSAVTNTGPSVLNGDLGVAPGTALIGFALPAVVNGASHANDAVATQAQADASTAYGVAAGQPVAPGDVLTGIDLGGLALGPGAYRFASSAQLTGALTLDAGGDPNAQFVFQIGSTLTTASASSVVLTNGASACNVFWQVGSSATLGTGTSFQGNLLASTAVTLASGTSLVGRAFASTAAVSLDTNTLTAPTCATPTPGATPSPAPSPTPTATIPSTPGTPGAPGTPPSSSNRGTPGQSTTGPDGASNPGGSGTTGGSSGSGSAQSSDGRRVSFRAVAGQRCTAPFRARVRGEGIARVSIEAEGRPIATRTAGPFTFTVDAGEGRHRLTARVSFNDGRDSIVRTLRYRACARAALRPRSGPAAFAG